MLLVIDIGNSHTVVGLYDGEELRGHWRLVTSSHRTHDELRILFTMLLREGGVEPESVTGCCISSVVPDLNTAFYQVALGGFRVEPVMVEPGTKTGIKLRIENPKEVGADRIVNAVAATEEHSGPLIVIDFGTATTFDYLTADAEYCGGVIVPGIALSAEALFEHCAKLPRVELAKTPTVIGRNTVANIRSGLTYGYADLVDGLIRRMEEEIGDKTTVIATGGLAPIIADVASGIQVVDPLLSLKGLRLIYQKNERIVA